MQKTMDRLGTLNMFYYPGMTETYIVFRQEIGGSHHWKYEWHDIDMELHTSGYFHKVEHVIKHFVQLEREHFQPVSDGCQAYTDDKMMQIILEKIAGMENPQTRDWLLHKGE